MLVILGLLVGGVLSGQSLIRAAELRSVSADLQKYRTSVYSFRDKYFALPGDMNNATQFWGAQNATPATCRTTASSSALTCDGDGDGIINQSWEIHRFWQHLANAGLIEGGYTGVGGSGGVNEVVPGTNAPLSKISSAGYGVFSWPNGQVDAGVFSRAYGNIMVMGKFAATGVPEGLVLRGEEAWNIDTKLDDGKPAFGFIFNRNNTGRSNCTTSDTASTAEYALSNTSQGCSVYMLLQ